ncbi:hypothetical protein ACHWQZ_G002187 [Mnemiopsis leidyi]
MHTNGSSENSKSETNGSTASDVENAEHFQSNNLNNKVTNLNGHDSNGVGSHGGRVFIPPHQKDTVRLIGQHLLELGLQKTVDQLVEEGGSMLEHPLASQLRKSILTGEWESAMTVFSELCGPNDVGVTEMKYKILEQKYLELLEKGERMKALICLQEEITPLQHCPSKLHLLPSYLMCSSPSDLRARSKWTGANGASRQRLIHKIQEFLPSSVMLPPKRLEVLLKQALLLQAKNCVYHNSDFVPHISNSSLLEDHNCTRDSFPTETKQILEHCDEVNHCTWSNNGLYLATGALDGSLYIWKYNPQRYQLVEDKLITVTFNVGYISWSPDDTMICVCGVEKCPEAVVYTVAVSGNSAVEKCRISQSTDDVLTCCAWSPDSRFIYTGGQQGQFYKYEVNSSAVYNWEGVRLHSVATLRDNKTVLAADSHKRVRSYNFEDNTDQTIYEDENQIMNMSLSSDEKYCLLTLSKQGLVLVDIASGTTVRKYFGLHQSDYQINSCFGGANEQFILSGSEDNLVYIFKRDSGVPILKLPGHTRLVSCVSWNPVYTDCFVSGSDDTSVRLWGPRISSEESESIVGTQV